MSQIQLDRNQLLGFDDAQKLQAKVGGKPSVELDRNQLLGFDDAQKLQAKVGKKPVNKTR
jgi:hypothetical protein